MKACTTLCRCQFDVNCMMLFAVIGVLALQLQEFGETAAVTFLFAISEALKSKCTSRARNALAAVICLRPEYANLINPITREVIVLLAVGSMVQVKPGDLGCEFRRNSSRNTQIRYNSGQIDRNLIMCSFTNAGVLCIGTFHKIRPKYYLKNHTDAC